MESRDVSVKIVKHGIVGIPVSLLLSYLILNKFCGVDSFLINLLVVFWVFAGYYLSHRVYTQLPFKYKFQYEMYFVSIGFCIGILSGCFTAFLLLQ